MSLFSGAACNVKVPYSITAACDFNQADSDHMTNTPASNGNQRTFTVSVWIKLDSDNDSRSIFHSNTWPSEPWFLIGLHDNDGLIVRSYSGSVSPADHQKRTNTAVTEGSWQHIVVAVDTTDTTDADKVKIYFNGTKQTSFATDYGWTVDNYDTGVNQTAHEQQIGEEPALGRYFNGEMAEFYMIDGQQLTPSEFAVDDGGTWKAIEYTGTFGTAGFHLDFADSSDLGNDVSGNGEHFNEVNIVSGNQITSNLPPFKS